MKKYRCKRAKRIETSINVLNIIAEKYKELFADIPDGSMGVSGVMYGGPNLKLLHKVSLTLGITVYRTKSGRIRAYHCDMKPMFNPRHSFYSGRTINEVLLKLYRNHVFNEDYIPNYMRYSMTKNDLYDPSIHTPHDMFKALYDRYRKAESAAMHEILTTGFGIDKKIVDEVDFSTREIDL